MGDTPTGQQQQTHAGNLDFVLGGDTVMFLPWYAQGRLLRRSREIASAFTRHGLGWLLAHVGLDSLVPFERGWLGHPARQSPYTQAEHLRMALGELGATFIKLGQALSTRADLLPPEYVAELARLQDDAPPVPFSDICDIICQELGRPPEELLATFDPEPLASASIGQVHTGTLEGGNPLVIKVQRPGVAEQIEEDLQILSGMARWAAAHTTSGHNYNLPDLVEEFAHTLRSELDYRREGHHVEQFRQNFAGDGRIIIPRVYWEYSNGRVLTLERVSGIKVADVAALDEAGIDRHLVADNAVQLMLRQLFEFGLFHADPHPGNFFVQPDGAIALIDFGMVGHLDQRLQDTLLRLGLSVARQDIERLVDELYTLGVVRRGTSRTALRRDLDHLLSRYAGQSLQELAAREVTEEMLAIAFRHHLQLPGELVLLLRVIAMSEGLGLRLNPDYRLVETAEPYLKQFWLRRYSPWSIASRLGQAGLEAAELGLTLPRRLSRLLDRVEQGDLEVSVNHEGLREFTRQLQRMTNRLSLAILLAATIVALGLVMLVYHPPGWERLGGWLFALAFFISLGFGVWLMWSIWRAGR